MTTSLGTRRAHLRTPFLLLALALTAVLGLGAAPALASAPTSASTSTEAPVLVRFGPKGDRGVTVQTRAEARTLLPGAPRDFQRFVGRTAARLDGTACDPAAVGVFVVSVRSDGFARGGVNECGGYAALWARVDGRWKQVQGTQDIWDCSVLRALSFPNAVAGGKCYDPDVDRVVRYRQR